MENPSSSSSSSENKETPIVAKQPVYKPTVEAYNQWASIYDTDGNFLQALDSIAMEQILPLLVDLLPSMPKIVDLGCGTGRTTLSLLRLPAARLLGLDNSSAMLDIASERCNQTWNSLPEAQRAATLSFNIWDVLAESNELPDAAKDADAIVSTLVVEHIPLDVFFSACSGMVKKGGVLLLTNMHSDMGAETQAGFTDPRSGEKVRPVSFVHTIAQVVEEAKKRGFEVVWGPEEKEVREDDVERVGNRAKKWVGKKVWFGIILKKA
ncbi:MAG: hypothetical protein LQ338_002874 [Usnochroma carphineum]|nr:MAG: hypothetical protein LQ338_002874 [Usnochroma carphineum]